ncbi:MAG: hypothetical protein BWK79_02375 [Beggiatoa sp. IS2]|nr:MAG: hypothetical protein BWK79_02375 [Beggiatoa sp. IS2]
MKLRSIWIETTTRCNLKCKSCGSLKGKKDIDLNLFYKIAEQCFPDIEEINITGVGEPTMTRNFNSIASTIVEKYHKRLIIITHGMLLNLNAELLNLLVRNNVHLTISVDGIGEVYEELRRGAKWAVLLAVFDEINQLKQLKKLDKFTLGINFTLNSYNMRQLPDLIKIAGKRWQVDYLLVIPMQPWNLNADFYETFAPKYFVNEVNKIIEISKAVATEIGVNVIFPGAFDSEQKTIIEKRLVKTIGWFRKIKHKLSVFRFRDNFYALPAIIYIRYQWLYKLFYSLLGLKKKYCKVPSERLFFKINGEVTPCCGMQNYVLGSMQKQNLGEILADKHYLKLADGFFKGYLPIECLRCHLPMGPNHGNPDA